MRWKDRFFVQRTTRCLKRTGNICVGILIANLVAREIVANFYSGLANGRGRQGRKPRTFFRLYEKLGKRERIDHSQRVAVWCNHVCPIQMTRAWCRKKKTKKQISRLAHQAPSIKKREFYVRTYRLWLVWYFLAKTLEIVDVMRTYYKFYLLGVSFRFLPFLVPNSIHFGSKFRLIQSRLKDSMFPTGQKPGSPAQKICLYYILLLLRRRRWRYSHRHRRALPKSYGT